MNLDPSGSVKLDPVPSACEDCNDSLREDHGCGFDLRFAGKAHGVSVSTKADEPHSRTCPQFYLRQPGVQEVYADLKDYRRGALSLEALPAAYLALLREADSAEDEWGRIQQEQLSDQRKAQTKAEEH